MRVQDINFLWCDKWCIDKNEAWFIPCDFDALFHCNMVTGECDFLEVFPDYRVDKFRANQYCLKYNNDIYCMPDMGKSIWIYCLDKREFCELEVKNNRNVRLGIQDFWLYGDEIYAVSIGLGQIIEISLKDRKIKRYYNLCEELDAQIGRSTITNHKIFSVSSTSNCIYQFDIETKEVKKFVLPGIDARLYTICYDGQRFWLSGFCKAIYIWDIKNNDVKILDKFPQEFSVYKVYENGEIIFDIESVKYEQPVFIDSVVIGQTIWFIPFMATEIVYFDKNIGELENIKIDQEKESRSSISTNRRRAVSKYSLVYMREERYIGLYSFKNECYLEIDTLEKKVNYKKYVLSDNYIKKIIDLYNINSLHSGLYYEDKYLNRNIFRLHYNLNNHTKELNIGLRKKNIGTNIYQVINE